MTYAEAKKAGYRESRVAYQRGYVSRKINTDNQEVHKNRFGELYVLLPCWSSTFYCYRQYLIKEA